MKPQRGASKQHWSGDDLLLWRSHAHERLESPIHPGLREPHTHGNGNSNGHSNGNSHGYGHRHSLANAYVPTGRHTWSVDTGSAGDGRSLRGLHGQ